MNSDEELLITVKTERRGGETSKLQTMKKYTKLSLCITAILSTLCFFFYKYRYDRLYNVIQVLEVFGTPDDPSFKSCSSPPPVSMPPSWHRLSDSVYLYASYCEASLGGEPGACASVATLAVARGNSVQGTQCKLWFEGSTKALEGVFSHTSLSTPDNGTSGENGPTVFRSQKFNCESKYPTREPFAVIYYQNSGDEAQVPIEFNEGKTEVKSPVHLCILPEKTSSGSSSLLRESLLFHSLIKTSQLTLYSLGIPRSLLKTLNKLQMEGNENISLVSWNIPRELPEEVQLELISNDCYYRSRDRFLTYAVLRSNQVLMPEVGANLGEVVRKFAMRKDVSLGASRVDVRKFCSEYPTEKQAKNFKFSLGILESTFYNKQLSDGLTVELNVLQKVPKLGDDGEDSLSVHEYGSCDRYDFKETDKTAVYQPDGLRFAKDLLDMFNKFI